MGLPLAESTPERGDRFESAKLADGCVLQPEAFTNAIPYEVRIRAATGEEVERHETLIRVGVDRAVAFVEHDDGRAARRRVAAEAVPHLGDHRGAGGLGGLCQGVEEELVVQAEVARDPAAVYEKVLSLVQRMNPPNGIFAGCRLTLRLRGARAWGRQVWARSKSDRAL